eukprot:350235-Chlamydomonas_euryale.AAC.8
MRGWPPQASGCERLAVATLKGGGGAVAAADRVPSHAPAHKRHHVSLTMPRTHTCYGMKR